ncbi:MAG: hypothetical protein AB7J86_09405, partial [Vulcanimicrobiota bacterium]
MEARSGSPWEQRRRAGGLPGQPGPRAPRLRQKSWNHEKGPPSWAAPSVSLRLVRTVLAVLRATAAQLAARPVVVTFVRTGAVTAAPTFSPVASTVTAIATAIATVTTAITAVTTAITAVTTAIAAVATAIATVATAIATVATAIATVATAIATVATAIATVATAIAT